MAAGLLVTGLAGCAKSDDNAGGDQPMPAASAAPADAESCIEAGALKLDAGLLLDTVRLKLEAKGQADAIRSLANVMDRLEDAKAKVKDPKVKVIVDEFAAALFTLKTRLETPGADPAKLGDDINATFEKMEQMAAKLAAICGEQASSPGAGKDTNSTRAKACARFSAAFVSLEGPFIQVGLEGIDRDAEVKKLHAAIDSYLAETTMAMIETDDPELKTAITADIAEVQKLKLAVSAARDIKALEELNHPPFLDTTKKVRSLCGR